MWTGAEMPQLHPDPANAGAFEVEQKRWCTGSWDAVALSELQPPSRRLTQKWVYIPGVPMSDAEAENFRALRDDPLWLSHDDALVAARATT
jgi:hypothetical protein